MTSGNEAGSYNSVDGNLVKNDSKPQISVNRIELDVKKSTSKPSGLTDDEFNSFLAENVIHSTEQEDLTTTSSEITPELREGLRDYANTELGEAVIRYIISNNLKVNFINEFYADMSFSATDLSSGEIEILYTDDLETWKEAHKDFHPGNQIRSATMGSLLAHEFGHTQAGRGAKSLSYIPQRQPGADKFDKFLLDSEEVRATRVFENSYRRERNMPIRTHYSNLDVVNFNSKEN